MKKIIVSLDWAVNYTVLCGRVFQSSKEDTEHTEGHREHRENSENVSHALCTLCSMDKYRKVLPVRCKRGVWGLQ